MSADGKTNVTGGGGRIASAADRARMDRLRAAADVVVVGANTVRLDDPLMHVRCPEAAAARASGGHRSPQPLVVVVAGRRPLPAAARLWRRPPGEVVAVGARAAPAHADGPWPPQVERWQLGDQQVCPASLLQCLQRRGARRVLIEGGGRTLWPFAQADLIDELSVTVVPCLLGGEQAPTWLTGRGWAEAGARRLQLVSCQAVAGEIVARWMRCRETWAPPPPTS